MQLPTKIGIAGAVMSVLGVGFGWGIFPWFLKSQIAKVGIEIKNLDCFRRKIFACHNPIFSAQTIFGFFDFFSAHHLSF